ncbi:MAG: VCBS repeat-containing protein [Planctomycetes bacterium]|nr:VCBS repeat-containing protein [Planctomycetota bacterium]
MLITQDVDHDGDPDVLIAWPSSGDMGQSGRVVWCSSKTGREVSGLTVSKEATRVAEFGRAIACLDDIDNDGRPDIAVSLLKYEPKGIVDAIRYYSCASGMLLREVTSADVPGLGELLFSIRDVDGDARSDLVLVAPAGGFGEADSAPGGAVRLVSGTNGKQIWHRVFPLKNNRTGRRGGTSCGDVNGDGVIDIHLKGLIEDYVISGRTGDIICTLK